jgi:hypothetical protein
MIDKLGRVLLEEAVTATPGVTFHGLIRVSDLPAGFYIVRVNEKSGSSVKNIIIR